MAQLQTTNFNQEAIRELLDGDNQSSIFYKYKAPAEVGEKILDELYSRFDFKKGFRIDDSSKDVGILSQCQSLQSLLLLTSSFSLEFDEEKYFKDNRTFADGTKPTIRKIMDSVIEDIIRRIIRYNGKAVENINTLENDKIPERFFDNAEFCFDASPFDSTSFTAQYSYIDTITWVIPTFLLVLKYHATKTDEKGIEDCKWEKCLIAIIRHGLKYINDSFIIDDEKRNRLETSNKLEIGWNFTKECEEPSLYFTFSVCECYVDFYETFKHYIDYLEALRRGELGLVMPSDIIDAQKMYEKNKSEIKLKELFMKINGAPTIYTFETVDGVKKEKTNTLFGELEQHCKMTANKIWKLSKNELADRFYYNDLGQTLDEEVIKMSTTSDALFNSVYIVNILLDAGVDEDIKLKADKVRAGIPTGDADEKERNYQEEYDDLLEVCQLAIQKAMRTYEKLKKDSKEYIVDQFLVGFNETFKRHNDMIKDLRKRRIRVFSLAPLLIHSNNVIGQYLVRYPQYNMKKYLGYILENRLTVTENGSIKTKWIWESDGFFSASNYYYVSALGEFYDYYDAFEKTYLDISDRNEEAAEEIRKAYKQELDSTGEIADLKSQLEDKDDKIKELEALERPVEDAVKAVVEETIKEKLSVMICEALQKEIEAMRVVSAKKVGTDRKMTELTKALNDLMLEMIAFDGNADGQKLREGTKDDARTLIKKELSRVRSIFVGSTMHNENHQCGLFDDNNF